MKKWISSAVLAILMTTGSLAYADLKIGVVDMNQILSKSPLMTSLNDNLSKTFKPRQDEINNASKALQDEVNQLNYSSATMSADDKTKLQNKVISDKANLQILNASFQKDIALAKDQALRNFMAKFSSVINKVAQDGHYDIIEQRNDILFVNDKIDITQEVLKQVI